MHNHTETINNDPAGGAATFNMPDRNTFFLQLPGDKIRHRLDVDLGFGCAHYKIIGNRRELAQVQNTDVVGIFVAGELSDRQGQAFWCNSRGLLLQVKICDIAVYGASMTACVAGTRGRVSRPSTIQISNPHGLSLLSIMRTSSSEIFSAFARRRASSGGSV